eukprot:gene1205-32547_t
MKSIHVCTEPGCVGHVFLPDEECCPRCSKTRYISKTVGGHLRKIPRSWFIDFGVKAALDKMFANEDFCEQRGSTISREKYPGSYWSGTEATCMQNSVFEHWGVEFDHSDNSCYKLLFDFVKPYDLTGYSSGILGLSCDDVHPRNIGKKYNNQLLSIIPGPAEPQNLTPYIWNTLWDFHKYGEEGVILTQFGGDTINHRPFLTGLLADSPARQKLSRWNGTGAYRACGWCLFQGQMCANVSGKKGGTIYYKGYHDVSKNQEVYPQAPTAAGYIQVHDVKVGHSCLQLSHAQRISRAQRVEEGEEDPRTAGCHGLSMVVHVLPYVDYNNFFLVPVAHALLFGVVKGFVKHLYRPIPKAVNDCPKDALSNPVRSLIASRKDDTRVTSEMGRPYKCIGTNRGYYTMEDWLHFVETYSAYVFQGDTLPPKVKELWGYLVEVCQHYFRGNKHYSEEASEKASQTLRRYAEVMEEEGMADNLFTYNLHMVVCRLRKQEVAHGSTVKDLEFRVEREMQSYKDRLGRRVCVDPEKISANAYLIEEGVAILKKNASITYRSYEELAGRDMTPMDINAKMKDTASDVFGATLLFLGPGRLLAKQGPHARKTLPAIRRLLEDYKGAKEFTDTCGHWTGRKLKAAFGPGIIRRRYIQTYRRAEIAEETFSTRQYKRTKTRINYMVRVDYGEKQFFAELLLFVKLTDPEDQSNEPLKVAIVRFYEGLEVDPGRMWKFKLSGEDNSNELFVLTQHISTSR